jgi:uncharacterized protein (DUF1330 family)
MTIDYSVLEQFKPFLLGYCNCGCDGVLRIVRENRPPKFLYQHHQRGPNSNKWKGGHHKNTEGYILVSSPYHPHCNSNGYVMEHRLVMEKHLGRYLRRDEQVHHIDENIENNDISNLFLTNHANHRKIHRKDKSHRFCLSCKNKTTYIDKNGIECWRKQGDGFICLSCYWREFRKRKKQIT